MIKYKYTIEYDEDDQKFINSYQNEIELLSDLVLEMMVTNPSTVLSPVVRKIIVEKAKLVKKYHLKLNHKLRIDNPFEKLEI